MKLFKCFHCSQPLYFENYFCGNCGMQQGFDPQLMEFIAIADDNNEIPKTADIYNATFYKFCHNRIHDVCNWLVTVNTNTDFCLACQLNRTITNLNDAGYRERWSTLELAKHRLIYSMLRLSLPVVSKTNDPEKGLFFDFKADGKKKVFTGHANGIITINISEADDIEREMARRNLD